MPGMKKSSGVAGTIHELDPQIIEVSTSGIDYPASKSDLLDRARGSQAPQIVIDAIHQFEDRDYKDPEDVKAEFKKIAQK